MEPSHRLSINLDVVVPKSQRKAWLFGSDYNARLRSALAETGVPELQLSPQHGVLIPLTSVMGPLLLHSHLANIVRTLSALCHMIQDFSGRSFHYMGIRKEESLVGGTVTWNNFKMTAALNGQLNEQSLTPLILWGWLAGFAASLSFASRRKISKCYTENRSWNKLPHLKAHRDTFSGKRNEREKNPFQ